MRNGTTRNPSRLIWKIVDCFYPPICAGCGSEGANICPDCANSLVPITESFCPVCGKPYHPNRQCPLCGHNHFSFTAARAAFVYSGVICSAIKKLKYTRNLGLSGLFSDFLLSVYLDTKWDIDLVTAVPLYKKRYADRGFNQSEWIAKPLSRAIGKPFSAGALQKAVNTTPQAGLSQQERSTNLREAFRAEPVIVKEKNVLIVDDVMTTGSTFNECAQTLRKAGASKVYCLSVASTVI